MDEGFGVALGRPERADFLDAECEEALAAIKGPSAALKRTTVILLAVARASGMPFTRVFADPRAGGDTAWYCRWKKEPAVMAAFALLEDRVLRWHSRETALLEARVLNERRRVLALASLDAVLGLRVTALNLKDRADFRTQASKMLLALADQTLAARIALVERGAPIPVDVKGLDDLIDAELERMAAGSQAGCSGLPATACGAAGG